LPTIKKPGDEYQAKKPKPVETGYSRAIMNFENLFP
jgi:hypothetical protein